MVSNLIKGDGKALSGDWEVFNGLIEKLNVDGKTLKINGEGVKRCQCGAKGQWGGIEGRRICVRMIR